MDAHHLNMERPKFEQMKTAVTSENIRKKGKEVWVDNREKNLFTDAVRGLERRD